MLNTCSLSGSLEFWYTSCREEPCGQPQMKTLRVRSLTGFPGQKCCIRVTPFSPLGQKCSAWPFTGGTEHKEAYTWIPPDATCIFYFLWYCPVSFQCRSLSCDYNYTLTRVSSPNVRVILRTLRNRITAYLGLNSFFVSFKRRKWQFSNAMCPITEGPDDLPWMEPRPAFPPYNYVLLLFSICNCKKMGPDFHIVLPGNEHPPTHWIPGIHATF